VPLVVQAEDADEGQNAVVRYKMAEGSANFSVDSQTGEIRPTGLLDFELLLPDQNGDEASRSLDVIVAAVDSGSPQLSSEVTVAVFVTDVNDHAPAFERASYVASVDEDAKAGDRIIQVRVSFPSQTMAIFI